MDVNILFIVNYGHFFFTVFDLLSLQKNIKN